MPVEDAKPILRMHQVGKTFLGVRALDGVSFDLFPGEIHALVGENGAGKSTLMKVLGGVYPAGDYDGTIEILGQPQHFGGVRDSAAAGVAIVFQELSLVPQLSIAENIFLGRLPSTGGLLRWNDLHLSSAKLLQMLGVDLPSSATVGELSLAQQQLVEIAKALSQEPRILVLDEPTAALNDSEAETLFAVLGRLRERGIGMIYISHRLDEVVRLADRITVLRDGRTVATKSRGVGRDEVISMMVGREISQVFAKPQRTKGELALEVRSLSATHPTRYGHYVLNNISFQVHCGEVVGIAGLMGSGRSALLNALFGAFRSRQMGEVKVFGSNLERRRPSDGIAQGIALVTEDRKRFGLSLSASILENLTVVALRRFANASVLHKQRETAAAEGAMVDLRVKAPSPETVVGTLSGGNQQKVVLGRWLLNEPRILLLDEPTRGIDIAAKQEIYERINHLAEKGMAIVMVSSEMEELQGLCDRILVMHEGRVTGAFDRDNATPELIMACATGSDRLHAGGNA
jgi:D-xylose transport system ATP-binding protein